MKLEALLKDMPGFEAILQDLPAEAQEQEVTGVTADSREVKKGVVFVAIKGTSQDGHAFIPAAQSAGAALIVSEENVAHPRYALAQLAARYYGNPSHTMLMVGVTGTSGKTTTTYLIESILKAAGKKVGVIGTVNFRFEGKILPSTHTTPGAVELQKLLAEMKSQGCNAVVMEVSSHALKQQRTACIAFDGMVFTNLSPEHLDFHPDMEDYFQSKAILFTELARYSFDAGKYPFAAVNADDSYGQRLLSKLNADPSEGLRVGPFSTELGSQVSLTTDIAGSRGMANGFTIHSALTGQFNLSNILGALVVTHGMGLPRSAIENGITQLKAVPGRLEKVENDRGLHILVDYAHKPDALEKVLGTLREIRGKSRLITVFGCGGDRDRKKRPMMGKIAVELSDHVFITSDNPRTENPAAIIEEILKGTTGYQNFSVESDRKKAIFAAIRSAKAGDIILIAGKGHEDYQIISDPSQPSGTRKIHFDDREVASQAIQTVDT